MPPKTRSFTVDFALYGIGRMEFDDVTVVPVTLSNLMDVLNFPCGYFDKLFCLGEGQVLPMLFALGCPGTPDGKNPRRELELPQGFKVVSWRREHPLLARKENTYTFDLSKLPPSVTAPGFNRQWGAVALPVQSSLKPSPQTFTARCRTRGGDARYYRALAEANSLITGYENVRYAGRDISSSVTLTPVSPFPKAGPLRTSSRGTPCA